MRSPNAYMSEHHMARSNRRKRERQAVAKALEPYSTPSAPAPAIVTFTRFGPALLDRDNLAGAFKSSQDAVASWLGTTDAATGLIEWRYEQIKARDPQLAKGGKTTFRVWFTIDICWDVEAPPPEPPTPALEAVQVPGLDPPVRCRRIIYWPTAEGEVLARVRHRTPESKHEGSELVLARKRHQGRTYLHGAVHYSTGGRRYRTLGLALFSEDELRALRDACDAMLADVGKGS